MQAVLTALKDIPGVVGSFVLAPQGALLAREMPAIFPESIFPDLGRRLGSVGEVLDAQMAPFQELLLKFDGHWLFIRRTTDCFLTVLTADTVNYPALRMATNVALRQITQHLPETGSMPTPDPTPVAPMASSSAATATPPAAPPPAGRPRRMWRGQVVD